MGVLMLHSDVVVALHMICELGMGPDVAPTPLADVHQGIPKLAVGFL